MSEDKQTLSMTLQEVFDILHANHWNIDVQIDYAGRWYTITNLAIDLTGSGRAMVQLCPEEADLLEEDERFFTLGLDANKFRRVRYA